MKTAKLSPKNFHLARIVKAASQSLDINEPIIFTWTRSKRGKSFPTAKMIFIPHIAIDHGKDYLTYYIVHELCHVKLGADAEHNKEFKEIESKTLREFNICIEYTGDYALRLSRNGEITFDSEKEPTDD
jgi:predicted metal-dependent hydrolase